MQRSQAWSRPRRLQAVALVLLLFATLGLLAAQRPAAASTLPSGFHDTVALSGLTNPTVVQFASDGRIFVGQKNGMIKVFSSLTDTAPVTFADLSCQRARLLGPRSARHGARPRFPTRPYVYVLYAYDAPIGGRSPTWGDGCPTPPGATTDGCVVSRPAVPADGERVNR